MTTNFSRMKIPSTCISCIYFGTLIIESYALWKIQQSLEDIAKNLMWQRASLGTRSVASVATTPTMQQMILPNLMEISQMIISLLPTVGKLLILWRCKNRVDKHRSEGSRYPKFRITRPLILWFVNRTVSIRNFRGLVIWNLSAIPDNFQITRPFKKYQRIY